MSKLRLFGLNRIFALFTRMIGLSSRKFQRLRERIAEETYLERPETYWGQQFPSLGASGAALVPWIQGQLWIRQVVEDASRSCK